MNEMIDSVFSDVNYSKESLRKWRESKKNGKEVNS